MYDASLFASLTFSPTSSPETIFSSPLSQPNSASEMLGTRRWQSQTPCDRASGWFRGRWWGLIRCFGRTFSSFSLSLQWARAWIVRSWNRFGARHRTTASVGVGAEGGVLFMGRGLDWLRRHSAGMPLGWAVARSEPPSHSICPSSARRLRPCRRWCCAVGRLSASLLVQHPRPVFPHVPAVRPFQPAIAL